MLAPNLDPGSSVVEIDPAPENAMPTTASCFGSRGSVVVDTGNAVLNHATVDGKSVP
jgi:hypothetical protein